MTPEDLKDLSVMNKLFAALSMTHDPEVKQLIGSVIDDLDRLKPTFENVIPPSGRKSYGGET